MISTKFDTHKRVYLDPIPLENYTSDFSSLIGALTLVQDRAFMQFEDGLHYCIGDEDIEPWGWQALTEEELAVKAKAKARSLELQKVRDFALYKRLTATHPEFETAEEDHD